jgi:hypothetical protein
LGLPFDRSLDDCNDQLLDFVSEVDAASLSRWRAEAPHSSSSGGGITRSAACDGVDDLFATEDGHEVYASWSGRQREAFTGTTSGDTSILPLARLDAWISTRCVMMSVTATSALAALAEATEDNMNGVKAVAGVLGKGRAANSFSEVLAVLLPKEVMAIQKQGRRVVERLAPGDLRRSCTFAQACVGTEIQSERDLPDMHENGRRQLTLSFECPPQWRASVGGGRHDLDCVVLTAAAFRVHICYWIGDV